MSVAAQPLTSPDALAALYDLVGDHSFVDAIARAYPTWQHLTSAPRADLAWRVGPWAAALRLPAACPPLPHLGHGVSAQGRYDSSYPARLTDLDDAPVVLYSRGHIPTRPMLAVGGSHYPGEEGRSAAQAAARAAAAARVPIVAALDSGCGHAALEAAVAVNAVAVAVCASDLSAPSVNTALIERIVSLGGAVISEWGPGVGFCETRVFAASRIVAALGSAVVLAELGSHPSGGAHLARYAIATSRYLIVPAPDRPELTPVSALGTAVLAWGRRFNPESFGTSTRLERRVRCGNPAADAVVSTPAELASAIVATCSSERNLAGFSRPAPAAGNMAFAAA